MSGFDDYFNQAKAKAQYLQLEPVLDCERDKRSKKSRLKSMLVEAHKKAPTMEEILEAIRNRKREED